MVALILTPPLGTFRIVRSFLEDRDADRHFTTMTIRRTPSTTPMTIAARMSAAYPPQRSEETRPRHPEHRRGSILHTIEEAAISGRDTVLRDPATLDASRRAGLGWDNQNGGGRLAARPDDAEY